MQKWSNPHFAFRKHQKRVRKTVFSDFRPGGVPKFLTFRLFLHVLKSSNPNFSLRDHLEEASQLRCHRYSMLKLPTLDLFYPNFFILMFFYWKFHVFWLFYHIFNKFSTFYQFKLGIFTENSIHYGNFMLKECDSARIIPTIVIKYTFSASIQHILDSFSSDLMNF